MKRDFCCLFPNPRRSEDRSVPVSMSVFQLDVAGAVAAANRVRLFLKLVLNLGGISFGRKRFAMFRSAAARLQSSGRGNFRPEFSCTCFTTTRHFKAMFPPDSTLLSSQQPRQNFSVLLSRTFSSEHGMPKESLISIAFCPSKLELRCQSFSIQGTKNDKKKTHEEASLLS